MNTRASSKSGDVPTLLHYVAGLLKSAVPPLVPLEANWGKESGVRIFKHLTSKTCLCPALRRFQVTDSDLPFPLGNVKFLDATPGLPNPAASKWPRITG